MVDTGEIKNLPVHVAIIMDGNGRWARQRNLPRVEGHLVGMESVREIVTTTRKLHIPYLTLYAFSKENWKRPKEEVKRLLELLEIYLEKELPLMMEKGIRLNILGDIKDFPKRVQRRLQETMDKTKKNRELCLNIALSYSARKEILQAATAIAEEYKRGAIKRINERVFEKYLWTKGIPDPDLLIRTSGEMRISNFLLWQLAYTELYITDTLWPDFREEAYIEALKEYSRRDRRFGSIKEA
ncbi:MAG TPA: isoprenyl transferase [Syntrophorhabdaceae bacterium]|nr:isoprenyl transferase [Syntrophorhabdaceae bacterium]HPU30137.1 isoprenyl transferase [Syntrophorhabdaceae bacterium]